MSVILSYLVSPKFGTNVKLHLMDGEYSIEMKGPGDHQFCLLSAEDLPKLKEAVDLLVSTMKRDQELLEAKHSSNAYYE